MRRVGLERNGEGEGERLRGDCFEEAGKIEEEGSKGEVGRVVIDIEESVEETADEGMEGIELDAEPSAAEIAAEDAEDDENESTVESTSRTSNEEDDDDEDDDVIEIEEEAFRKFDLLSAV